ncbi:MAG: hypothetical protein F6K04_21335, partial [Leptolyngbya sp. SIO4C5]|nr:hypothetical protein [Leptolyngbya sp. SIO4C5]
MSKLPVNRSDFGLGLQIQLEKRYGLDLRSLAGLRLGLAIALLALVANHLQFGPVYGNAAATPLLLEGSLRFWTSELPTVVPWIHGGLLGLTAIAALFLLLGYRTRWAAIAAWLLVSLLPVQSAAAEFSSERLLPAVLFWAMFLPLGASYAIDSALNLRQALPSQLFTAATLALRVRQSLVYGFWIFTLLSAEATASPLVALYFGALLLLWTPVRTTFCRTLAVILGLLGTVLFFPAAFWLEGAVWLAFLPTAIWQSWAERCYGPPQADLRIYYDADCGFCKKVVHLLRTLLL